MAQGGQSDPVTEAMQMMAQVMERASSKVAVPLPPAYDGRDPTYTIIDLFKLFEPYATAVYGAKSKSWLLALQSFVGGDVKEALTAIGPIHSGYDEVKQQLIDTYSTRQSNLDSPHAQFIRAERRPGESLHVFRFRLQRLANEAFPTDPNKNKLLISKFLINLTPEIRNSVEAHILNYRDPELSVIVDLANTLERNHQTFSSDPHYVAMVNQISGNTGYNNRNVFRDSSGGLPINQGGRSTTVPCQHCKRTGHDSFLCPFRDGRCYRCNEKGHFARNCNQRRNYRLQPAEPRRQEFSLSGDRGHTFNQFSQNKLCAFCEEAGHPMARCEAFLTLLKKCNWCGATTHGHTSVTRCLALQVKLTRLIY